MPTENWYPISSATHDLPAGWDEYANNGGANKNASTRVGGGRAGPATHDDDTSYLSCNSAASEQNQALNCDWPGPMASVGSTFTANYRHRTEGVAGTRKQSFTDAAANEGTRFNAVADASAVYASTGPQDVSDGPTYHPTGAAWSVSDFVDDQTIFPSVVEEVGGANFRCTSIWGSIEYTPPAGGFAFLLNLAPVALPLIGSLTDFSQFCKMLEWRRLHHPRRTEWAEGEIVAAWRDVQAYRWPTFFRCGAVA